MRDLRWAVAGLVVGTTLLTGCADKSEANDSLPSTSAAPTTEALPPVGPVDFPVPDEARTKDAAGAEAFARYYIDLINRQQAIPDGQPLRDLGPGCQDCLRVAQQFDETAAAGHHIRGGELSLIGDAGVAFHGDTANVTFIGRIESIAIYDASGALVPGTQYEAEDRLPSGFELTWSSADDCWLASGAFFG